MYTRITKAGRTYRDFGYIGSLKYLSACLLAVTISLVAANASGADCNFQKRFSVMRAEALYPITALVAIRGGCQKPVLSFNLRYSSHMSKKVVYYYSAHPEDYFGFSLLRVTPKQLESMTDKMIEEFKKPLKIAELRSNEHCDFKVPPEYLNKLIEGQKSAHAVYRSNSAKAYLSHIEEIDQYAVIAVCSKARNKESDLAGVPADPTGRQVFAPNRHGKYPLSGNHDLDKTLKMMNELTEVTRYANRRCEPYDTAPHSLEIDSADICHLVPNLCNSEVKKGNVKLFCSAEDRTKCFDKKLWSLEDPRFAFAKALPHTVTSLRTATIDGHTTKEACVHWN